MPDRATLAKIHIAKKELCLDDDEYRFILKSKFNVESAKDLTDPQANALLTSFRLAGWNPAPPKALAGKRASGAAAPRQAPPSDGMSRKARALWITMAHAGAVQNPSEMALNRYVKRMAGVDALRFCDAARKGIVINSLKSWQKRDLIENYWPLKEAMLAGRVTPSPGGGVEWHAAD